MTYDCCYLLMVLYAKFLRKNIQGWHLWKTLICVIMIKGPCEIDQMDAPGVWGVRSLKQYTMTQNFSCNNLFILFYFQVRHVNLAATVLPYNRIYLQRVTSSALVHNGLIKRKFLWVSVIWRGSSISVIYMSFDFPIRAIYHKNQVYETYFDSLRLFVNCVENFSKKVFWRGGGDKERKFRPKLP